MNTAELTSILDDLAYAVAEDGCFTHRTELELIASEVQGLAPGAAAALVDWSGSEVARLRAFGVVHGVLVERLHTDQHAVSATDQAAARYRLIA